MKHFLQGEAWQTLQREIGAPCSVLEGEGWSARGYLVKGKINTRLYVPYGPVLNSVEALPAAIAALRAEGKRLGAAFLRCEPTLIDPLHRAVATEQMRALGLFRVRHRQPEFTQLINLERPFHETLGEMRKGHGNLHRNYRKKGISIRQSEDPRDVEHLIRLLQDVSDRTGMIAHGDDYLRAQAKVLIPQGAARLFFADLAEVEQPIAAAMVFDDEDCRYYMHAAADTEHRRLQASTLLLAEMMADSTSRNQALFDMFGVVPKHARDHAWTGFSDFKRSFGGTEVAFSGTWELPIKPFSYASYHAVRFLARKLLHKFID